MERKRVERKHRRERGQKRDKRGRMQRAVSTENEIKLAREVMHLNTHTQRGQSFCQHSHQ